MINNGDIYQRDKIGAFFVTLTSILYGGEITRNGENDPNSGNPDIMNWERNQVYESKASVSSDHHKIKPSQIDHYEKLENSNFPMENPEIYYFLWQYNGRGISKVKEGKLESEIIKKINGLIILSFDIIKEGRNFMPTTGINSWGEIYTFRSSQRKRLIKNPESFLEEVSLDKEDFLIKKETISENEYKYKQIYIPPFDIVAIRNKGSKGVNRIKKKR